MKVTGKIRKAVWFLVVLAMLLQYITPTMLVNAQELNELDQDTPAQGWVVYITDNDIVVASVDGEDQKIIYEFKEKSDRYYGSFYWSPDGKWLLMNVEDHLFLYNPYDEVVIDMGKSGYSTGSWSPDSSKILYKKAPGCLYSFDLELKEEKKLLCGDTESYVWGKEWEQVFFSQEGDLFLYSMNDESVQKILGHEETNHRIWEFKLSPSNNYYLTTCCTFADGPSGGFRGQTVQSLNDPADQIEFTISGFVCEWRTGDRVICYDNQQIFDYDYKADIYRPLIEFNGDNVFFFYLSKDEDFALAQDVREQNRSKIMRIDKKGNQEYLFDGKFLSISKDEQTIVFLDQGSIFSYQFQTKQMVEIGKPTNTYSLQVGWSEVATPVDLTGWADRKYIAIQKITHPSYEWLPGIESLADLPVLNEEKAVDLLSEIQSKDDLITQAQAAAFQRLVLQEEAIANMMGDFETMSNDEGSGWTDWAKIFWYSLQMLSSANMDKPLDWFKKTVEDSARLAIYTIPDPKEQEQQRIFFNYFFALLSIGNASDVLLSGSLDIGEVLKEFGFDLAVRYAVASINHGDLIEVIQPVVDQGVNSVFQVEQPYWETKNSLDMAEKSTQFLVNTAHTFSGTAHSNFLDFQKGLDLASLYVDFSDLPSLFGSGTNVYVVIFRIITRAQYTLLEFWRQAAYTYPAKQCIQRMMGETGAQAFTPDIQSLQVCDWKYTTVDQKLLLPSSQEIDEAAWDSYQQDYDDLLSRYAEAVHEIQQDWHGKQVSPAKFVDLDQLLQELDAQIDQGFVLITPLSGYAWDAQTQLMAESFLALEGKTMILLMALSIPQEYIDDEVDQLINTTLQETITEIEDHQSVLENMEFHGSPQGIGLLVVDEELYIEDEETLTFQYKLKNIGSGTLPSGNIQIRSLTTDVIMNYETPQLTAGEEVVLSEVRPLEERLPYSLVLHLTVEQQVQTEQVVVMQKPPPEQLFSKLNIKPTWFILPALFMIFGGMAFGVGMVLVKRKN